MNVVVVTDVLGKENNGTTTACMNLVRYLSSVGDNVKIVCCDKDKCGRENYYIVPTFNLGPINKIVEKNEVSLAKADYYIISKALEGADVCHIMLPFSLGRAAIEVAIEKGIPVTAGFHCQAENFSSHLMMMNNRLFNHLVYRNFYNHFYKHVDAIHYPTEFIKNIFENEIKHETNAYVISNGVNKLFIKKESNRPKEIEGKFVILFTGRFSKEKSHKVLVRAVKYSKYKDQIQLIFAGGGPRKEEILKEAKKCGIATPIMNFFSRCDLVDVINYSDLYCHPAEVEIEAIACLEAICCGLVPVISDSKRSATKYFALDDKSLFKCNDSIDLAKKIDYWIEHKEEKEKYSKMYIEKSLKFDQDYCMQKMRDMMIETIRSSRYQHETAEDYILSR